MSFLSPAFLLGLPLVAVPVLVHFFSRRQRTPIRWGAMEFLLASATPRRRFLRLRDLLLLLLRIAIVLAIIGALAQPMIKSSIIGSTGPRDVVIIFDNSMSTARRIGGRTVFDRELDEAAGVMKKLKETDAVRVLLASPVPEWLADAPVAGNSGAANDLLDRMRELKPNDGAAAMLECAQAAVQAEPSRKDATRFINIVTDGQAHGWHAGTPGVWASIQAVAKKAPTPVVLRVIVPEGASGPADNLAVEKVTAARAVVGVGQPVTLTATVKNTGTKNSAPTSLAWSTREESLGLSTVPALLPGVDTTVNFSQPFPSPGLLDITCRLNGQDDLAPDNSARFLLEVTQSSPILVVEGETAGDPTLSDARFFLAALGYDETANAPSASASIFHPKLISYQKLAAEELSACQCVVLADVPRVSADVAQKLARYVNSGGGLWMALGEQTDVSAFNQAFFEESAGIAPLPLRQPAGDADDHEKFLSLTPPSAEHPATALLADTHRLDIDRAQIYRRHQFEADGGGAATVLLRAEGGAPVAVERELGRGRVIVLAIPLGVSWSNLPLLHSYVVLAREWLWYLTEPGLVKRNLQAGEVLQATAPIESTASASLEMPGGRKTQLFGEEEDGRLVFRTPKTQFPGEYQLTISDSVKGSRQEKFLVGRDPVESDLTPLSADQIKSLSEAGGLEFGGDPLFQPPTQKIEAPPKALAMWLLMALIALLAVELAVAFWLAHRRRAAPPPVVIEPSIHA